MTRYPPALDIPASLRVSSDLRLLDCRVGVAQGKGLATVSPLLFS